MIKSCFLYLLFIVAIVSTLSGCSEESLTVDESVSVEWSEFARVGVADKDIHKQLLVFNHPQGLDNMLLALSMPQQTIDFRQYQVVMLGIGQHGEGDGFSMRSAREFKHHTQVSVDFHRPSAYCAIPLIGHSPIAIFFKIKTRKEIIISEYLNVAYCEPMSHH